MSIDSLSIAETFIALFNSTPHGMFCFHFYRSLHVNACVCIGKLEELVVGMDGVAPLPNQVGFIFLSVQAERFALV